MAGPRDMHELFDVNVEQRGQLAERNPGAMDNTRKFP